MNNPLLALDGCKICRWCLGFWGLSPGHAASPEFALQQDNGGATRTTNPSRFDSQWRASNSHTARTRWSRSDTVNMHELYEEGTAFNIKQIAAIGLRVPVSATLPDNDKDVCTPAYARRITASRVSHV
jgi:hypothetical protein